MKEGWYTTGIGLDACVLDIPGMDASLVQTTDFFYPLIDHPYLMVSVLLLLLLLLLLLCCCCCCCCCCCHCYVVVAAVAAIAVVDVVAVAAIAVSAGVVDVVGVDIIAVLLHFMLLLPHNCLCCINLNMIT